MPAHLSYRASKIGGLTGVEHVLSDKDRGLQEAIQAELPGAIWTPCHAHLRRNILDATPDKWREAMKDLLDEVLQASSQPEAWRIFEEILDGERQRMVIVVNEEGEAEEIDSYGELRQEAASALTTLEENVEDAADRSHDMSAPVSRREAKKRRKAASPHKSASSSTRGQGVLLNMNNNGTPTSGQA